ncbi:MAG: S8 family serine peptidase [Dermatophilaceae bacterium]
MAGWGGRGRMATVLGAVVALTVLGAGRPGYAAEGPKDRFTATALTPSDVIEGTKSTTGRVAQSDQGLLQRSDDASVNVMVKLDYDAAASYTGGIKNLRPTSPSVTGQKLTGGSAQERDYDRYVDGIESRFRSALAEKVPQAKTGTTLRKVYGGIALEVPAKDAKTVASLPGVVAVQMDTLQKPTATVEAPEFMGAATPWRQLGGQATAGKGVIFADIDSGVWPEHPMLADNPALGTPPAAPSGESRACVFGDNPLTSTADVFACNRKLVGGKPFLDTYNAQVGGEVYPDTARDSNGHGTHTTTTAAGNAVSAAPILGIDRGPISGVAPGAWVLAYKVCGVQGCYSSDSAAAVQQAILDGAQVINFSISGGTSPYSDPVELAFLDAYNAGILVSASAGNDGPTSATANHLAPWTMTVAASTQSREFASTLTVTGASGATASFDGATLTSGVTSPTPIVLAQDIPGYDKLCSTELPGGAATGKLVACQRGVVGRVQKGFNVSKGGAAGMILYNQPLADVETDNHFLPAIHLADGTAFLTFMAGNHDATGSFAAGQKREGKGDVMAAFSSRGPAGQFVKPDITAPGVQVLAGNTPTPDEVPAGPAGQYFQAIAGTSMSAPNASGSAILVKALHPTWTPGSVKSALMTTATTAVVKEDLTTPAGPFDMGSGRVDLTKAGDARMVFDESAATMAALGNDPLTAVNLNLPSVNVPTMPGTVTVRRTAKNVSDRPVAFTVRATSPGGSNIQVSPASGRVRAGETLSLDITIRSNAPEGQYVGAVDLRVDRGPDLHLPVAFVNRQGNVTLNQTCTPESVTVRQQTTCTVTAQNNSSEAAAVTARSTVTDGLRIASATGAQVNRRGDTASAGPVVLAAPKDAVPAIARGDTPAGGYLDLAVFGIAAQAIGDEQMLNYVVPQYTFGGKTYTRVGVTSNGYLVVNGGTAEDVAYLPQHLPDPNRPNGVLAPYWTDLDGSGSPGLRVANLTDGVHTWLVVQWEVHLFGDTTPAGVRKMQAWVGLDNSEDISYGYDPSALTGAPVPPGLTVGAENVTGTQGAQIDGPPGGSYQVTTTPGTPGGTLTYTLTISGQRQGNEALTTTSQSDQVVGTTRVRTPIRVTR